jgi:hypothetical protein
VGVAGDLDGMLEPLVECLDLGLGVGELSLELVDPSLGHRAGDGLDDLLGLAVERLTGSVPVPGHLGHVTIPTAEDGEGTRVAAQ